MALSLELQALHYKRNDTILNYFFRVKADATLKNIQFYKEDDEKRW